MKSSPSTVAGAAGHPAESRAGPYPRHRVIAWAPALPLLLACATTVSGQSSDTLVVGLEKRVSSDAIRAPLVEPHLAVNPVDPNHLVASAIVVDTPDDDHPGSDCATFVSFDGGASWSGERLGVSGCVDPWLAVLPDSTGILALVSDGTLEIHRREAGAERWERVAVLEGGHDHPTVVSDPEGPVHVVGSRMASMPDGGTQSLVVVASSEDGGESFRVIGEVAPLANLVLEAHTPAVLPGGDLLLTFGDHDTADGREVINRVWTMIFDPRRRSFSRPAFVTEGCFGPGGWPTLAVIPGSATRSGRVVHACVREGLDGIVSRYSDDRGRSWSPSVRVDRARSEPHAAVPTLAADRLGTVAATWYDRGENPERACQHLRVAVSLDSGESFPLQRRLSSVASCPADDPLNRAAAGRWPHGGDYGGLVARRAGSFQILWADARDGVYSLWTAEVTVRSWD